MRTQTRAAWLDEEKRWTAKVERLTAEVRCCGRAQCVGWHHAAGLCRCVQLAAMKERLLRESDVSLQMQLRIKVCVAAAGTLIVERAP